MSLESGRELLKILFPLGDGGRLLLLLFKSGLSADYNDDQEESALGQHPPSQYE
jgi:hypothetical protein